MWRYVSKEKCVYGLSRGVTTASHTTVEGHFLMVLGVILLLSTLTEEGCGSQVGKVTLRLNR